MASTTSASIRPGSTVLPAAGISDAFSSFAWGASPSKITAILPRLKSSEPRSITLSPVKMRASRMSQLWLWRDCRASICAFLRLPRSCVCQMPVMTKGASAATTHNFADGFSRSSFSQRNSLKQTNRQTAAVASSAATAVLFCSRFSPRSRMPCMPSVRCVDGRYCATTCSQSGISVRGIVAPLNMSIGR